MASDPGLQGSDKRRSPRVGAPKVVVRIPSADRFRSHYLKDLSEGGLFIRADRTFPVGSDLVVDLWPPGANAPLTLQARIARVVEAGATQPGHPAGMAVTFVGMSGEVQSRLRALIDEHGRVAPLSGDDDPLAQVQRMVAELDEARDHLAVLSTELAEARGQIEAYAEQSRKLETQENEARALAVKRAETCAALELENQRLREELAGVQARQRDLGKAISEAGKKVATGKHKPAPAPAPAAPIPSGASKAPPPSPRSEPPVEIIMPHAAKPPPPPPAAAVEVTDSVDLAFDALLGESTETNGSAPAPEQLVDEPLFAEHDIRVDVDPHPAADEPDALSSFLSADGPKQPEARATAGAERHSAPPVGGIAGFVLESSIADGRVGYEMFSKKIKLTTRLMPADALQSRKPSSADEAMLSELLGASPTFETLLNQMGGQMKDLRLRQMLYELYARALVDLREG